MFQKKINTKELFASLDNVASEFLQLIASLSEKQINTIPFKDSWTAGQLAEHITKSNTGIAKALNIEGKPTDRNPGERERELKEMFLDFTIKFPASEFLLPTKDIYNKETVIADLKKSIERLKQESDKATLSEAINHRAFGEITKLELLHFAKFHTQRHLHQLKKIVQIVKNK